MTPDDVAADLAHLDDGDIAHIYLHLNELPEAFRPLVHYAVIRRGLAADDSRLKPFRF